MSVVTIIFLERWTVLLLSCVIILRTARGFLAFGRGDQWPSTFIRSLAFLYALSAASLQFGYLVEGLDQPAPIQRLAVSLGLQIIAALFAVWGMFWLNRHPIGKMRPVYMHVNEALSIAELAELNPRAARRLADEAKRLTADCIVNGRCDLS